MRSVLLTSIVFLLAVATTSFNEPLKMVMNEGGEMTLSAALQLTLLLASLIAMVSAIASNTNSDKLVAEVQELDEVVDLERELEAANKKLAELTQKSKLPPKSEYLDATVLRFVGLLQEKGRLVDFAMEDISQQPDERVGMVARIVHQGVKEVLNDCFSVAPLHAAKEGETIVIESSVDGSNYKFVGAGADSAKQGVLLHRGWKANSVNITRVTEIGQQANFSQVICPTEVKVN